MKLLRHSTLLLALMLLLPIMTLAAQPPASAGAPTQVTQPASAAAYHLPPEKEKQAEALALSEHLLHFGGTLWSFVVFFLLLATGSVAKLERWVMGITPRRGLQGLIFWPIIFLVLELLTLPLDAIGHHLSLSNGISVQHWGSWLGDQAKEFLLSAILLSLLLLAVRRLIRKFPRRYWMIFWAWMLPFQVAIIFLVPVVIDPLFNKFEPLAPNHPALVTELQKVVARTGTNIPTGRMFLMKASEKTNGINAYVTGIGATKRIVIWDTTADRVPTDQILFIFGHESGHYVLKHIPKYLAFLVVLFFFVFWTASRVAEKLFARYGKRWQLGELGSLGGIFVFFFVFSVAQFVLEPITNTASRFEEHEADVYGQEAMHGILPDPQKTAVASFNRLGETYLEPEHTNRLLEIWSYSHPAIEKRTEFAAHYNPWEPGNTPRFSPGTPVVVKPMGEEAGPKGAVSK
jgi:Zn-dependent protease with chaperone function